MSFFDSDRFQKWCWIELIGFDNTVPDFGVSNFLKRAGFVPTGISLLLSWLGFVFQHNTLSEERKLSSAECSYSGHEYCPERRRQDWTNLQLQGLIQELHKHGVKVYLSFFNLCGYVDDDGVNIKDTFHREHPELLDKGTDISVNVLKRLSDKTYYEDLLQTKVVKVLCDYDFDGIQIADGISSGRLTIQNSIAQDDMLVQFQEYTGISIPKDEDPMDFILHKHYTKWIYFHTARFAQFYRKFYEKLTAAGKEAMFNNAWTCGPFDAMYRYGVDYRLLPELGATNCMAEDVSAGLAILSEGDNGYLMTDEERRRVHYQFLTKLMLTKASMPTVDVCPLTNIHDNMEQWGVLEHMPTSMVCSAASNLNTYIYQKQLVEPIAKGPFYCLCDSLTAENWAFIRTIWERAFTEDVYGTAGVTLVWSDRRLDREIEEFYRDRRLPTTEIVSELMYASAPISAVVRSENLADMPEPFGVYTGALLVTNPDLLSDREFAQLMNSNRRVLVICPAEHLPKGFRVVVRENNTFENMVLAVNGSWNRDEICIENPTKYSFDSAKDNEVLGGLWTLSLKHMPYSNAFWIACADAIMEISGAPIMKKEVVTEHGIQRRVCKYICVQLRRKECCKVIMTNDDYWYNCPSIDMQQEIESVVALTKYKGYRVPTSKAGFSIRVPGRGAEIIEVTMKE